MKFLVLALTLSRILAARWGDLLRSWYWRHEILRTGGSVGDSLLVKKGAALALARGCRLRLGSGVVISEHARVHVGEGALLEIGDGAFLGVNALVAARGSVRIGAGAQIAHNVTIIDHDHNRQALAAGDASTTSPAQPVEIGARAWIGAGAIVLKGVRVSEEAVVAAGAVAAKSVPARTLARGRAAENHPFAEA